MLFNFNNYAEIQQKIAKFAKINQKTSIIAVSKSKSESFIEDAIKQVVRIFGENRVQEALKKFKNLKIRYNNIELHMLGPLQTNKVKKSLEIFDFFHTLDRESLAKEFYKSNNYPQTIKKNFFIQINTGMEKQKSGIAINEADNFISYCKGDLKINIIGLMCIPPVNQNPISHFNLLKKIAKKNELKHLSMGMSSDYEIAIKEGATYIRIGTLLFGKR